MAPEQFKWVNQVNLRPMLDDWKVDQYTDVFAVGMLLRCLILGRQDHHQPWFLGNGNANTELNLTTPPVAPRANFYSVELRSVIDMCLQFKPTNRLTFDVLLDLIREYTDEAGYNNLGRTMRSGTANPVTTLAQSIILPANTYALNMARNVVPGPAL